MGFTRIDNDRLGAKCSAISCAVRSGRSKGWAGRLYDSRACVISRAAGAVRAVYDGLSREIGCSRRDECTWCATALATRATVTSAVAADDVGVVRRFRESVVQRGGSRKDLITTRIVSVVANRLSGVVDSRVRLVVDLGRVLVGDDAVIAASTSSLRARRII